MSDRRRLGPWAIWGLSVMGSTVACVDGSLPANQGSVAGASSTANTFAAGASGTSNAMGAASGAGNVADGSCKDTRSDPAHCGTCDTACAQGQICDQGVCKAPVASCVAPQVSCNGACADLTSTAHCGTCEQACVSGQSCSAGACVCPGAQLACNGACVDTQTSVEHCGGCSKPCATGAVCTLRRLRLRRGPRAVQRRVPRSEAERRQLRRMRQNLCDRSDVRQRRVRGR